MVSAADNTNEPRQPSLLEKKRNIAGLSPSGAIRMRA
jgi:hypothetical protein